MPLYLVRHGETHWNVERRLQGQLDSPLTLRGLEQIRCYGAFLRALLPAGGGAEIRTSPLPRARQTAAVVAEILDLPSHLCFESELLAERRCGEWEGARLEDLAARHGEHVHQQWRQWSTPVGGHGETLAEVHARARAWLALPRSAAHVIVVSHGIMSRQFRGAYLGLDPEATMALERHVQDRIYKLDAGSVTALPVPGCA